MFIVAGSLNDPFNRAPYIIVKRIVIRRVWRPHIRGSQVKSYPQATSVCVGVVSFWNMSSSIHSFTTVAKRFGSPLDLLQRCVGA